MRWIWLVCILVVGCIEINVPDEFVVREEHEYLATCRQVENQTMVVEVFQNGSMVHSEEVKVDFDYTTDFYWGDVRIEVHFNDVVWEEPL